MTYVKGRGRRFWLPASLAVAVVAITAAVMATAAMGRSTATPIKFAIMSDCGGAFAANYEQDIGGAITAISQFGGAKPNNPNSLRQVGTAGRSVAIRSSSWASAARTTRLTRPSRRPSG